MEDYMKKSVVGIVSCESYESALVESAVRKGLDLIGGIGQIVKPAEKIVLKPNVLQGSDPERCVTTHPEVFRAVAKIMLEQKVQLSYGDSPGDPMSTVSALKKSGFLSVAEELGIGQADFDHGKDCAFADGVVNKRLTIADAVLTSDGVVSLPKLKTHGLTRITGAIKNQFGCVPGMKKGQYHAQFPDVFEFSKLLADITLFVKPRLYVMDAIYAMEGNGPQSGDPKKLGVLLFSTDPVAIDTVACLIVDVNPEFVPTNVCGRIAGLGTDLIENIELLGEQISKVLDKSFVAVRKPPVPLPGNRFLYEIRRLFLPRPVIDKDKCIVCKKCIQVCPVEPKVLEMSQRKKTPQYDYRRCIRCYCCHEMCPAKAIHIYEPTLKKLLPFLTYASLVFSVRHSKRASKKGTGAR
jgi:uncharacterized protein (DUF362 family)/Pyruvate/2-oxoacid:ferredoxin oxidoreductase delta subunit